ncbi:putative uncharacterized protein DDB_G0292330 [Microplitis demolitor]|uniref:putative uncharacterized protein DDB_G0292330 n=1 Tax=Microplitis demolitor TaxID=69319 RepID=UPI0006D4C6A1|nr:putative uncharacterized protein DDB_G0292330 [Microplitis demolitor]
MFDSFSTCDEVLSRHKSGLSLEEFSEKIDNASASTSTQKISSWSQYSNSGINLIIPETDDDDDNNNDDKNKNQEDASPLAPVHTTHTNSSERFDVGSHNTGHSSADKNQIEIDDSTTAASKESDVNSQHDDFSSADDEIEIDDSTTVASEESDVNSQHDDFSSADDEIEIDDSTTVASEESDVNSQQNHVSSVDEDENIGVEKRTRRKRPKPHE